MEALDKFLEIVLVLGILTVIVTFVGFAIAAIMQWSNDNHGIVSNESARTCTTNTTGAKRARRKTIFTKA